MLEVGWWPTFNVADVFIVSGIALLLVLSARSAELDRPEIPPKAIPQHDAAVAARTGISSPHIPSRTP